MDTKLAENYRGGVFLNEATFQKIYDECLENEPQVPESLRKSYKKLTRAFEDYLEECNRHTFRYAYQCGYEAAQKGGVAR